MNQLENKRYLAIFSILCFLKLVVCEHHWVKAEDGSRYIIETDYDYTWNQALLRCAKKNMTLATINSSKKNNALVKILQNISCTGLDLWIGATELTSKKSKRNFAWISNGNTVRFNNWETGEPNDAYGGQPCVHTWSKTENFTWADGQCNLKYGYICQLTFANKYPVLLKEALKEIEDELNDLKSAIKMLKSKDSRNRKVKESTKSILHILEKLRLQ